MPVGPVLAVRAAALAKAVSWAVAAVGANLAHPVARAAARIDHVQLCAQQHVEARDLVLGKLDAPGVGRSVAVLDNQGDLVGALGVRCGMSEQQARQQDCQLGKGPTDDGDPSVGSC